MEITRQTAVATYVVVPLIDASSRPSYKASPTLAAGDVKIVRHTGGAWDYSNIGTLPAIIGGSVTKQILVTLTATEMTSDNLDYPIIVQFIDQTATKEWDDQEIIIWTKAIPANATQILGTAISTPATAGILDVNVKNMNNVAATSITTVNANIGTTQPINFTGTGASALVKNNTTQINSVATTSVTTVNANIGQTQPLNFTGTGATAYVKTDMVDIAGAAVSTTTAQLGVNAVQHGGTTQTGRDIGASVLLSPGTGTGQISLASGAVTVGTNNDKTGYALSSTQTFNLTGNITGSLSGSVGSVTNSVGSIATGGITDASYASATVGKAVRTATAQGGAETSITLDASASAIDRYYKGLHVKIASGTGAGQVRRIAYYDGTTKIAYVNHPWMTNPDATSVFVIQAYSQEFMVITTGVVTAGGSNTITLVSTDASVNDTYKGAMVKICGGTGVGQIRTIIAYNGTTKIATVEKTWVTNPDNTSVYEIVAVSAEVNVTHWADTDVATPNTAGVPKVDIISIDGQLTNGNNATLNLKKLNVVNSNGQAVVMSSADNAGLLINSDAGTTAALVVQKWSTNQAAVSILGSGSGAGLAIQGGATGHGITVDAGVSGNGSGILTTGYGTGGGLKAIKGASGTYDFVGTIAASVSGTIDSNLVSIDGQLTNGNNATLNLKKLNIVNNAGDAIVASSTGSNGNGMSLTGHGNGNGLISQGGVSGGHGIKAKGGDSGAGTAAGNALHLDGSTTAVSGLSEDQGCGLYVSSRSQMSPAVLIKGLTGGLGSGIYVRTVVNGIACLLEGSGVGSAMQLTGGSVGNAITLVGGATSGRAISASTTDGDAVYINAGGAGSTGVRATGSVYGIKALATDTGGIGLFVEGALNGATFLGDNGYGVSMSGSGTAHAGCFITTSSTNADALKLVGNGSGKDISAKEIDAIKTKTDQFVFTVANRVDATAAVTGTVTLADGSLTSAKFGTGAIDANAFAQAAADKVWSTTSRAITDKAGFSLSASQTFNLTGNITGNLSGSVGSVTGAVTVGTNNDKTGYALTGAYDAAKTAASASALSTTDGKVDGIKTKTDQLIFTGGYLNGQVKGMDTDVLSSAAVSSAAVSKIQSGLALSTDITVINGKLDTIYTTEGTIINAVSDVDGKAQTIVDVLPLTGRISNLALTDSIDTVSLSNILTGILSMTSGRFKKDYPVSGEVTFYKSNGTDVAFVMQVTDTERVKV